MLIKELEELIDLAERRAVYYNHYFIILNKRKNDIIRKLKYYNNKLKRETYETSLDEYSVNHYLIEIKKELYILEHIIGYKDDDHNNEMKLLSFITEKLDDIKDFIKAQNLYEETIYLLNYKDNFLDMLRKALERELKVIQRTKKINSIKTKEQLIKFIKLLELVIKTNELENNIIEQNEDFIFDLLKHMSHYLERDIEVVEVEFSDMYRDVITLSTPSFTPHLMRKYRRFMDNWIKLNYNYVLISFIIVLFTIFTKDIKKIKRLIKLNLRHIHSFTIKLNRKINKIEKIVGADFDNKHYEDIGRMIIYFIDLID